MVLQIINTICSRGRRRKSIPKKTKAADELGKKYYLIL